MNIFIFVKQVPDTEARIRIGSDGKSIQTADINFMDSPYDEYAVEQALLLSEANPGSTTTVITIGPERAAQLLRDDLAKGIQEAVHIKTDKYGDFDALTTSKIISAFLKDKQFDILLFGNKAYGSDNSQVPSMVAALLDIAQVNLVTKMNISGNELTAERQVEGMTEVVKTKLPVLISTQKGLNEPRMKSLKGIMAAKKKEIPTVKVEELGLTDNELTAGISILKMETPPSKKEGQIFEGEPEEAARKLVEYLTKEIKAI